MALTDLGATRAVLTVLLAAGATTGLSACDAASEVPLPAPVSVPAVPPGPAAPPPGGTGGGVVAPPPAADRDEDVDDGPEGAPDDLDDGGDDGPDD